MTKTYEVPAGTTCLRETQSTLKGEIQQRTNFQLATSMIFLDSEYVINYALPEGTALIMSRTSLSGVTTIYSFLVTK